MDRHNFGFIRQPGWIFWVDRDTAQFLPDPQIKTPLS
jgi:hypothetical protein